MMERLRTLQTKRLSKRLENTLLFLVILFVPTQLGRHFFLDFSFIYSLRIDYLAPTIYFWDILVLFLLIAWFLNSYLRKELFFNRLALLLFLCFFLTQALSLFGSINLGAGLVRLYQLLLVGLFGVYIASQNLNNLLIKIKTPLLISLSFISTLAIFQFLLERSIGFWILGERNFTISTPSIANFNFFGAIFLRPYATFPHPNVLAGFSLLALTLIFAIKKVVNTKFSPSFKIISILTIITTILTFSRGAILILILELFLIFKKNLKRLLLISALALPFVYIRFSSIFNFDNLSFVRREELADIAVKGFLEKPYFGIGLNNFINYVSSTDLIAGPNRFLQPVHNIFLLNLVETGLLGFLGFSLLLLVPMYRLLKTRNLYFSKALLLCFGIIFILGLLDHYFLTLPQGQRILFLIWGISLVDYTGGDNKKSF